MTTSSHDAAHLRGRRPDRTDHPQCRAAVRPGERNLGRLIASCLLTPERPILTAEDLEPIRPREWTLTWRQMSDQHTYVERERAFDNEPDAVAAANALLHVEATLGDVRAVHLAVRCSALAATPWEEVGL